MNKLIIPGALALLLAGAAAAAPGLDAPPPYGGDAEAVQAEPPARKLPQKGAQEDMSIAPTQADMEKARRDREAGQIPPKNNDKRTKIEAVRRPARIRAVRLARRNSLSLAGRFEPLSRLL